ncbi:MAG: TonB-dependent receptor [Bacteroidales bacterium]|nr:TonB-dependent receptor [Bacteroidales bacterium]
MKKILFTWLLLFFAFFTFGQTAGIEGLITTSEGNPAVGAYVSLSGTNQSLQTTEDGKFIFENLKLGDYQLIVTLAGYDNYFSEFVTVEEGKVSNIGTIQLTLSGGDNGSDVVIVNADDLNSEQGSENISSLLNGSNDVFLNSASYSLGPMRFRIRGYDSENTEISINGASMENMETGRTYWSNWGGLNHVTKYKNVSFGLEASDNTFGNIGGSTDIEMIPSKYRKGLQLTYSLTNRSYRNRAIMTYSTGLMPNNWAVTVSGSRRWANEGYVEGSFYDSWGYYLGVEKKLSNQTFVFNVFGSPTKRGKAGGSTQDMYDITGNNFYNPYWGYQGDKKRNSRIAILHMPTAILSHYWDINESMKLNTTIAVRAGKNGSTALNWYSADDPRPDYYRFLPSYSTNAESADAVEESLANDPNYSQINWAQLYYANENSFTSITNVDGTGETVEGKMSQYIIEERRYDEFYGSFNTTLTKKFNDEMKLDFGLQHKQFVGKNFKVVNDLLGGDFWYDIDKYAEREPASTDESSQSNLEQPNHVVYENDIFGYNYNSNVQESKVWTQYTLDTRKFNFYLSGYGSYTSMWRDGKMQNGKFPDNSLGQSEHLNFVDYGVKTGLMYKINGRNFVFGHAGYLTKAPTFRNAYISPRTRDNVIDNLTSQKIMSADIGYSLRAPRIKASFNAFYTTFEDQTQIMSFYHDGYRNFVNYAMSGINKTHQGLEAAIEGEIFTGFSAYAVTSLGYYRYTSRPTVSVTVDNSSEILAEDRTVYVQNFLVDGTPQTAGSFGLKYRSGSYWFFGVNANYIDDTYLSFNPERRTEDAVEYVIPDSDLWNDIILQEKLPSGYTIDASIGKSFRFDYKYYLSINLSANNILDNQNIITGGYEQLRYDVADKDPDKFQPKYFYLYGRQFYLNVSFRF